MHIVQKKIVLFFSFGGNIYCLFSYIQNTPFTLKILQTERVSGYYRAHIYIKRLNICKKDTQAMVISFY